jgi:UDP-N-acetylmuramoylalanine--D-glutamate ligase
LDHHHDAGAGRTFYLEASLTNTKQFIRMSTRHLSKPTEFTYTPPAIAMDIHWAGVHALVIGLGESGFACARWLLRKGAQVTVLDTRDAPPMAQSLAQCAAEIKGAANRLHVHAGVASPFEDRWLSGMDFVVPSPGLSPHAEHNGPAASLLAQASATGCKVIAELDLFEWAIHHAAHASSSTEQGLDLTLPLELPKILAITGTNGKTTTTQMTVALLRRAGIEAQEAGNISPSLLDAVMQCEDQSRFPQVWVLELSSFQLALAAHFHPSAVALLNISQDHLDWHRDMQEYVDAKKRVFGIGIDPETSGVVQIIPRGGLPPADGPRNDENTGHREKPQATKRSTQSQTITFGTDIPANPGDFGLVEEGIRWMCMRDAINEDQLHRLMPADALRIRGRHNAMNALAALALCRTVTPALAPLLHALREFQGAAHRMQWVGNVQGVDFVNDSKGTNVGATAAGLQGLGLPLVLIAGGDGKGQDFSPLELPMRTHAKAVITIGRDGPVIAEIARKAGVPTQSAESMEQAVRAAFERAAPNAVVLLSPACASFDMFANYVARGNAFCAAVDSLAQEMGLPC